MLCIFKGNPITDTTRGRDSLDMQTLIEAQVAALEHSSTVRHTVQGLNRVTVESVYFNTDGNALSESEKAYIDSQDDNLKSILGVRPGEQDLADTLDLGVTRVVHISNSLSGLTMDLFMDDHSFGNGCTSNSTVVLKDDSQIRISWCVFPAGTTLTDSQLETVRTICETPINK